MKNLFMYDYFKSLTLREKLIVLYFTLSFCTLCVTDETPIIIVLAIAVNFYNAARLLRKVTPPEE